MPAGWPTSGSVRVGGHVVSLIELGAGFHPELTGRENVYLGAGLFGHGTLTATMNSAPAAQRGLALGAWGAVQASTAGLAMALGGILRDVAAQWFESATAYSLVYSLEILLLASTVLIMSPLVKVKP